MKTVTITGIILVVLGIIAFASNGITFTTQKKVVDIGPIHATRDETHRIPFRPILGGTLRARAICHIPPSTRHSGIPRHTRFNSDSWS